MSNEKKVCMQIINCCLNGGTIAVVLVRERLQPQTQGSRLASSCSSSCCPRPALSPPALHFNLIKPLLYYFPLDEEVKANFRGDKVLYNFRSFGDCVRWMSCVRGIASETFFLSRPFPKEILHIFDILKHHFGLFEYA